jgi:molybdopterin converting factor small subunit
MHIQVELWLWLGKEPGGDFRSLSEMRSVIEIEVEDGMTVEKLFDSLYGRYPAIAEKVFSRKNKNFFPYLEVFVKFNDRIVSPFSLEDSPLENGYKILIFPLYAGG